MATELRLGQLRIVVRGGRYFWEWGCPHCGEGPFRFTSRRVAERAAADHLLAK